MLKWVFAALSALVGVLAVVLVLSALSVAGTDDVTETDEFTADSAARAILLNEQLVPFAKTTATITATGDEELFIGTASGVDTEDYLTGVAHEEITDVHFPGAIDHRFVPGEAPKAAAADRDWWLSRDTGAAVSRTFELDDSRQTLVIAPASGTGTLDNVHVRMTMQVRGVFAFCVIGIAVALLAFGLTAFLLLRIRAKRIRPRPKGPDGGAAHRARTEAFEAAGVRGPPAAQSAPRAQPGAAGGAQEPAAEAPDSPNRAPGPAEPDPAEPAGQRSPSESLSSDAPRGDDGAPLKDGTRLKDDARADDDTRVADGTRADGARPEGAPRSGNGDGTEGSTGRVNRARGEGDVRAEGAASHPDDARDEHDSPADGHTGDRTDSDSERDDDSGDSHGTGNGTSTGDAVGDGAGRAGSPRAGSSARERGSARSPRRRGRRGRFTGSSAGGESAEAGGSTGGNPGDAAGRQGGAERRGGPAGQASAEGGPARRRLRAHRRGLALAAGLGATVLGASGCTPLPIAQPEHPQVSPYERGPLREGQAGEFLKDYTKRLDTALGSGGEGLDALQSGSLLERTRAEVKIAKADKQKLSAVGFSSVVAAGPSFGEYPMWFLAFGQAADQKQGTQAMLVQRESSTADWTVAKGIFVPTGEVPALQAGDDGTVARAPENHAGLAAKAAAQLATRLETGKAPAGAAEVSGSAAKSFRSYVEAFGKGDDAFANVRADCSPADDGEVRGLRTEDDGAVSLGDLRCAVDFDVPDDYSVNMGAAVKAVMTTGDDGSHIRINTSVPYLAVQQGDAVKLVTSDWFLVSAQTSKGSKDAKKSAKQTKTASPEPGSGAAGSAAEPSASGTDAGGAASAEG
ncbi:hypothetical protein GSY69_09590 [Brevibacterium sp. 5221]|uniref:DUF8094 domain-containing protein n=1 Tax=Brevibacterium rongguiense TaxID=2695267 RepID=A0A6N9H9N5_9MICO|nr:MULTISPECIES: hypothetical protein [Brevibacterium]MYM20212.1 hypothetical protein [Brevibacterium rongguiense]WAL41429.1 hypothetical protein BRM1_06190 [Brevibacterium sp. BRM-1]